MILLAFLLAFFNQLSGINFVLYYAPRIFEQAGRKQLMYYGSFGYIVSLGGVSWAFFTGAEGVVVVAFVCAFIASHAIGQGAVIWVFISEIFPNKVRDYGMSLGSSTHWVFAALITLLTPTVLSAFSGGTIFAFFAGMMVLQLLFVWALMPETKNKSLEELEGIFLPKDEEFEGSFNEAKV